MFTATQAIEQTVKARIKELETGKRGRVCPLCEYDKRIYYAYRQGDSPCYGYCPAYIFHEDGCPDDNDFHHKDPEMGVSFALALQYYYDIYKKTGKTLKE